MFTLPAGAEVYQWRDADGKVHYSDIPPTKGELRTLGSNPRPAESTVTTSDAAAPKAKTLAERELEFRQRLAEKNEAQAKAEEEQKAASDRKRTCEQAQNQLTALKSGQRITVFNSKGEREYLDDAGRAAEIERTEKLAADACK
jgi:hypothetical protein